MMGRPPLTSPSDRDQMVVNWYRNGLTMLECSRRFGVSIERVRQILSRWAPNAIRDPIVNPKHPMT